jgi:hypothetical protein
LFQAAEKDALPFDDLVPRVTHAARSTSGTRTSRPLFAAI